LRPLSPDPIHLAPPSIAGSFSQATQASETREGPSSSPLELALFTPFFPGRTKTKGLESEFNCSRVHPSFPREPLSTLPPFGWFFLTPCPHPFDFLLSLFSASFFRLENTPPLCPSRSAFEAALDILTEHVSETLFLFKQFPPRFPQISHPLFLLWPNADQASFRYSLWCTWPVITLPPFFHLFHRSSCFYL